MHRLATLITSLIVAVASAAANFVSFFSIAVNGQIYNRPCPPACYDLLDKLYDNTSTCRTDPTCFCSADSAKGVESCYQCDVYRNPLDDMVAENALRRYVDHCEEAGHPVNIDLSVIGNGSTRPSGMKMSSVIITGVALAGTILLYHDMI
ncbi:hypothetical protein CVT24_008841 [Panaeolus cyanescens]|uniref:Extracellular membrane protein CFEM domain-containing protein n=1 Tax=Panaeolus cyanescens TaxID=181874 RepID=A0A409VKC7_9AGAR|nr:hypothetical protein CVT24_008841 [Panaeolus cyanescens]